MRLHVELEVLLELGKMLLEQSQSNQFLANLNDGRLFGDPINHKQMHFGIGFVRIFHDEIVKGVDGS